MSPFATDTAVSPTDVSEEDSLSKTTPITDNMNSVSLTSDNPASGSDYSTPVSPPSDGSTPINSATDGSTVHPNPSQTNSGNFENILRLLQVSACSVYSQLSCKSKRQHLLTLHVSIYWLLALQIRVFHTMRLVSFSGQCCIYIARYLMILYSTSFHLLTKWCRHY